MTNSIYCFGYIVLLVLEILSWNYYKKLLDERVSEFVKNRSVAISRRLESWNDLKFKEKFELQWNIGLSASYIELACVEARPHEVLEYSFPPKINSPIKKMVTSETQITEATQLEVEEIIDVPRRGRTRSIHI